MKTMTELKNQFETENKVWKRKLDNLVIKHSEIISMITDDLSTKEALGYIDMAMDVSNEMYELDTKHKKFLLKWIRKFGRRMTINRFTSIFNH